MSEGTRKYNSPLREQRATETRESILEAALKLLAEGASKMTIPAVAKEAGVSVPTVYRHFSSKEDLEDGLAEYVRDLVGFRTEFDGLPGLRALLADSWARAATYPPGTMTLMLTNIGRNLGREDHSIRRSYMERCLADELSQLPAKERDRFVTVAAALASSPGSVALQRLGLSGAEAADTSAWILETLFEALRKPR